MRNLFALPRDFGVGVESRAETVIVGADVEISIAPEANRS